MRTKDALQVASSMIRDRGYAHALRDQIRERLVQSNIRGRWRAAHLIARIAEREGVSEVLAIDHNPLIAAAHKAVIDRPDPEDIFAELRACNERKRFREAILLRRRRPPSAADFNAKLKERGFTEPSEEAQRMNLEDCERYLQYRKDNDQ